MRMWFPSTRNNRVIRIPLESHKITAQFARNAEPHSTRCRYTEFVPVLTFPEARFAVLREISGQRPTPAVEHTPIESAAGRVLAQDIAADRAYPPFHRSMRD